MASYTSPPVADEVTLTSGSGKLAIKAGGVLNAHVGAAAAIVRTKLVAEFATWSNPVRAKSTVYRNTDATPRLVIISWTSNGGSSHTLAVGAANPPTTVLTQGTGLNSARYSASFIVPPNWYYRLNEDGITVTVDEWTEAL